MRRRTVDEHLALLYSFLIEQSHWYHLLSEYVIVNLQIMISMHVVAGDTSYKAMNVTAARTGRKKEALLKFYRPSKRMQRRPVGGSADLLCDRDILVTMDCATK